MTKKPSLLHVASGEKSGWLRAAGMLTEGFVGQGCDSRCSLSKVSVGTTGPIALGGMFDDVACSHYILVMLRRETEKVYRR